MGTEITYGETIRETKRTTGRAYESWARLQGNTKSGSSVVGIGSQGVKRTNPGGYMVGIDNIKKIAMLGVEGVNAGLKVMNGGSLFSLISLVGEINAVKNIKKDDLLEEIKDLSKEERLQLAEEIKQKLNLDKKDLEQRMEKGLDLVNEAIDIAFNVMSLVHKTEQLIKG